MIRQKKNKTISDTRIQDPNGNLRTEPFPTLFQPIIRTIWYFLLHTKIRHRVINATMIRMPTDAVLIKCDQRIDLQHLHVLQNDLRDHILPPPYLRIVRQYRAVIYEHILLTNSEHVARLVQLPLSQLAQTVFVTWNVRD